MPQETDRLKLPLPLGNETVTRESINGIFEKIDAGVATQADLETLREAVNQMDIPDASLTQKGKVQLSSALDSSAENMAATSKAVKAAVSEALSAKQLGVEQKANVVAALNSIGVAASTSETWAQLIAKMAGVIRATGNATVGQVLSGATFSNATGNGRTGTMPNRSAESAHQLALSTEVWQADRAFFRPPNGYYDGQSWVYALTPDLSAENIRVGKNILGVVGTLIPGVSPGDYQMFSYTGNLNKWSSTNTLFYSIKFSASGLYRISYTTATAGGFSTYYTRIYVDGTPLGTERVSTFDTADIIYTEDLYVSAGQTIQFMGRSTSGSAITMKNILVKTNMSFVGTVG